MPVTIRPCTSADFTVLQALYVQLHPTDTTTMGDIERGFQAMQAFPGCRIFIAELEEQVAGTYTLYLLPNMTHNGRPAAILENIVVDDAYRGQEIGRAMLEHARGLAEAEGCYKLSLTSNAARTDAHEFYRRCGMVQHGVSFRYELKRGY